MATINTKCDPHIQTLGSMMDRHIKQQQLSDGADGAASTPSKPPLPPAPSPPLPHGIRPATSGGGGSGFDVEVADARGQPVPLGRFPTFLEAARAHDRATLALRGGGAEAAAAAATVFAPGAYSDAAVRRGAAEVARRCPWAAFAAAPSQGTPGSGSGGGGGGGGEEAAGGQRSMSTVAGRAPWACAPLARPTNAVRAARFARAVLLASRFS